MSAKTPAERMRKYRAKATLRRAIWHALNAGLDRNILFTLHCAAVHEWTKDHQARTTDNATPHYIESPAFKTLNP